MEFIQYVEFDGYTSKIETKEEVQRWCPWAEVIIKVESGWICFESTEEHQAWNGQR